MPRHAVLRWMEGYAPASEIRDFTFYPKEEMTPGEADMIVVDDEKLAWVRQRMVDQEHGDGAWNGGGIFFGLGCAWVLLRHGFPRWNIELWKRNGAQQDDRPDA